MQISADQCRAARSLLNWTQDQLATNAVVSRATVVDFESNARYPMKNNLRSLADCMFAAGIEFIPDEGDLGVGVRFREQKVEYKKWRIDHSHNRITNRMRYLGEDFLCHVPISALEDIHRSSFQNDDELSNAIHKSNHTIIAAIERNARTHIRDGNMVVTYEMMGGT